MPPTVWATPRCFARRSGGPSVWAVQGCSGIGRHVATRLLADLEQVVDVPPKLSGRARVFSTGQGRKTDATDAHSIALVGTRMAGLRPVVDDQQLAVLRALATGAGRSVRTTRGCSRSCTTCCSSSSWAGRLRTCRQRRPRRAAGEGAAAERPRNVPVAAP